MSHVLRLKKYCSQLIHSDPDPLPVIPSRPSPSAPLQYPLPPSASDPCPSLLLPSTRLTNTHILYEPIRLLHILNIRLFIVPQPERRFFAIPTKHLTRQPLISRASRRG